MTGLGSGFGRMTIEGRLKNYFEAIIIGALGACGFGCDLFL